MHPESWICLHYAGDVTVQAGHRLPWRELTDFEIVFFPFGGGTVYATDRSEHRLTGPAVLLTRPGERHEYRFDDKQPTRHLFVHFEPAMPHIRQRFSSMDARFPVVHLLDSHTLVPGLFRQMFVYFHTRPARWRLMAEMLLLTALEETEAASDTASRKRGGSPVPPQIAQAAGWIERHPAERLDVNELARKAGWSHEHFTRTFQRHVGLSPKQYMMKRRMEHAAQLLLQSHDPVRSIAREVGVADEYYFYRLFRRWIGMTATQYRSKYADPRLLDLATPAEWSAFYPSNRVFTLEPDRDADE